MSHRPFEARVPRLPAYLTRHGKPCPEQARPFVLAATILASSMAFIDSTVVGIAIPALQSEFQASIIDLQWVANSYALMLGALILVGGSLGDRIGRRLVFLAGIAVFTLASILCALAWTVEVMIWARALQGVGAAALVPQSLALISANFPKDVRGKAIGTWAAASALTTALGPVVGGFLIDLASWRAAFWINVPIAVVTVWLALTFMEESRDEGESGALDWVGALVAVSAFGALTYGLTLLSDESAGAGAVAGWIVAGVVGLAAFLLVEARAAQPLVPLGLFRSPVFTGVNITTVFLYGALSGILFLIPFDMLARRGMTATEAGMIMLPFGLIIGLGSRFTGDLADTYGPRRFLVAGPLLVAVGCIGFATASSIWVTLVAPVVLVSVGMALVAAPLTTAVMNAAPEEKAGAASGISNTSSRLSGVIAIALFGALAGIMFGFTAPEGATFGLIPPEGDESRAAVEDAFLTAYNAAMYFAAAWCVVAAAVSYFSLAGTGPAKPNAGEDGPDAEPDAAA